MFVSGALVLDFAMGFLLHQPSQRMSDTLAALRSWQKKANCCFLRADLGVEKSVAVDGLDAAAVGKELEKLAADNPSS